MKIVTTRLELVPVTMEFLVADLHRREELPGLIAAAIGEGWPPPLIDVSAMEQIKTSLLLNPNHGGWSAWYALLKAPRTLIGLGGFKSQPVDGRVEFGYSLLPTFQGRGLGKEFVAGLVHWAFSHDKLRTVFAETLPELGASQGVLLKNGFNRAQEASEPGVLRFELSRTNTAGGFHATA